MLDPEAPVETRDDLLWGTLNRLRQFIFLEKRILAIIGSYSLAIGLFSLIIPLTVQELVNTFAIAIQPVMIVTLCAMMFVGLFCMGHFRVYQALAVENMIQRTYTRIALAMTRTLPRVDQDVFHPRYANTFNEAEFLPRAFVAMVADLFNVVVTSLIGMTILIFYHPYFIVYNTLLVCGFIVMITVFGRGGFRITLKVSRLNYNMLSWLQDLSHNLPHLKATDSTPLLMSKTDQITRDYVLARRKRSDILSRTQYRSAVIWQAVGHTALLGLAAWLLSIAEITLGQFVAAEVIVGGILAGMDTVARRMYAVYFAFTSFTQMAAFFTLPKEEEETEKRRVSLPALSMHGGVRVVCKEVSYGPVDGPVLFKGVNLDVHPGERVAIFARTSAEKSALAHVLAGLYTPTSGVVRYNDVDLRDVSMDSLNACRGVVLDSRLSLFAGSVLENITLERPKISYDDVQWALHFVELDEEIDERPNGVHADVAPGGINFSNSQMVRILLARTIVTRPHVLIFDGTFRMVPPAIRELILNRLCSKEESWSILFVSNDPSLKVDVDRRIVVS